jgi:hypothetical protein
MHLTLQPTAFVTPFLTGGPSTSNGSHTLFSGSLPPGAYDLYVALRLHPKRPSGHHQSADLHQRGLRLSSLDRSRVTMSGLDITFFGC